MSELMQQMILTAQEQHSQIYPCVPARTLEECFTVEGEKLILWFNTEDNSTHLISSPVAS
jgi:hypothetical protein